MITRSVSVVWPWFFYECKARILGIISNTQNMVMACIEKLLDAIEIRLRQSNMRSSDSIWTWSQGGVELDFKFRISIIVEERKSNSNGTSQSLENHGSQFPCSGYTSDHRRQLEKHSPARYSYLDLTHRLHTFPRSLKRKCFQWF